MKVEEISVMLQIFLSSVKNIKSVKTTSTKTLCILDVCENDGLGL